MSKIEAGFSDLGSESKSEQDESLSSKIKFVAEPVAEPESLKNYFLKGELPDRTREVWEVESTNISQSENSLSVPQELKEDKDFLQAVDEIKGKLIEGKSLKELGLQGLDNSVTAGQRPLDLMALKALGASMMQENVANADSEDEKALEAYRFGQMMVATAEYFGLERIRQKAGWNEEQLLVKRKEILGKYKKLKDLPDEFKSMVWGEKQSRVSETAGDSTEQSELVSASLASDRIDRVKGTSLGEKVRRFQTKLEGLSDAPLSIAPENEIGIIDFSDDDKASIERLARDKLSGEENRERRERVLKYINGAAQDDLDYLERQKIGEGKLGQKIANWGTGWLERLATRVRVAKPSRWLSPDGNIDVQRARWSLIGLLEDEKNGLGQRGQQLANQYADLMEIENARLKEVAVIKTSREKRKKQNNLRRIKQLEADSKQLEENITKQEEESVKTYDGEYKSELESLFDQGSKIGSSGLIDAGEKYELRRKKEREFLENTDLDEKSKAAADNIREFLDVHYALWVRRDELIERVKRMSADDVHLLKNRYRKGRIFLKKFKKEFGELYKIAVKSVLDGWDETSKPKQVLYQLDEFFEILSRTDEQSESRQKKDKAA